MTKAKVRESTGCETQSVHEYLKKLKKRRIVLFYSSASNYITGKGLLDVTIVDVPVTDVSKISNIKRVDYNLKILCM